MPQDDLLDEMELKIEGKCLQLMALQQPVARDLRRLGTMLKIVTDLERMADHAVDIAKATIKFQHEPYPKPLIDIPKMADIVQEMVHASIEAYIQQDAELAYQTAKKDDEVDALYKKIFNDLGGDHDPGSFQNRRRHPVADGGPISRTHRRSRHQFE